MQAIRLNISKCRLSCTVQLVVEELGQFACQENVTLEPPQVDNKLEVDADPLETAPDYFKLSFQCHQI